MKFWKQFILMTFLMPRLFTHCLIHSVKRSGKLNKATAFFWQKWLEFVHGKKPFTILNSYALWSLSQNRDLWFTLPPQRSLLVSWLFSAISIPCLKILFFIILVVLIWSPEGYFLGRSIGEFWKFSSGYIIMNHIHNRKTRVLDYICIHFSGNLVPQLAISMVNLRLNIC